MKEDSNLIYLTGMNDNYKHCFSVEFLIDFPSELVSQPEFFDRYFNKI
jgi:hypothetical protein